MAEVGVGRMTDNLSPDMPAQRIYIPYFVGLVPALFTGLARSMNMDCFFSGASSCDAYVREFALVSAVVLTATVVSFFSYRRTIIITNSVMTILWYLYLIVPEFISLFRFKAHDTIVLAILFLLPLAAAGIAIKRCVRPTVKSFWESGRIGE